VGDLHLLFFASFLAHSELGQSRHFDCAAMTSGLPLRADVFRIRRHVSNVPTAEVTISFDHLVGALLER
jgi:hypothetical protein